MHFPAVTSFFQKLAQLKFKTSWSNAVAVYQACSKFLIAFMFLVSLFCSRRAGMQPQNNDIIHTQRRTHIHTPKRNRNASYAPKPNRNDRETIKLPMLLAFASVSYPYGLVMPRTPNRHGVACVASTLEDNKVRALCGEQQNLFILKCMPFVRSQYNCAGVHWDFCVCVAVRVMFSINCSHTQAYHPCLFGRPVGRV